MAKCRFCYQNRALDGSFTASSEVTNRPVTYLASHARWKKWRSSQSTGDQWVIADFGTSQTIKVIGLVDVSGHTGGAVRAEYWDGAAWQTFGTFAIPAFHPTRVVAVWDTTGVSTSKVRIYFENTDGANEYVEIGVLVAGSYYQPTYNVVDGFTITPVDPSDVVRALGGQEEYQQRTSYHVIEGGFETEPEADTTAFRTMFSTVGRRIPVLAAIDPDNVDETFYARVDSFSLDHEFGANFSIPVRLVEAL